MLMILFRSRARVVVDGHQKAEGGQRRATWPSDKPVLAIANANRDKVMS